MDPKPFGYRVAVRTLPIDEETGSGLIVAGDKRFLRGIVVAVGAADPSANLDPLEAGDIVWWRKGHEDEIPHIDERGTDTRQYVDYGCILAYSREDTDA